MSQPATLAALRERIRHIEQPIRHGVLPFGIAAIDAALPGGGLALGAVHEIVGAAGDEEDAAVPAAFAARIVARLGTGSPPTSPSHRYAAGPSLSPLRAERENDRQTISLSAPGGGEGRGEVGDSRALGTILWCQKQPDLYGPGLAAHGLDPARLVVVTAPRDTDLLWTIEEVLSTGRTAGIAVVVAEIGRLPMVAGRRLQLAAERSGITAFLLRRWRTASEAAAERDRPTAALTRWRITALPSRNFALPHLPFLFPGEGRGPSGSLGVAQRWAPGFAGETVIGSSLAKLVGRPRWRLDLLRCRGGNTGSWEVEVADAAGTLCLSAGLADRPVAPPRRQTAGAKTDPNHASRRAG